MDRKNDKCNPFRVSVLSLYCLILILRSTTQCESVPVQRDGPIRGVWASGRARAAAPPARAAQPAGPARLVVRPAARADQDV